MTKSTMIAVRVSDKEKKELKNRADELNLTLTGYIKAVLFEGEVEKGEKSIEDYIAILEERIADLPPNTEFTTKEVIGVKWRAIEDKGKKLLIGRKFKQLVDEGKISKVKFKKYIEGTTALYEKY